MEPNSSLLSSCHINTSLHLILVECTYPLHTTVAGFQVIACAPDYSETHKLYSSKAESPQRQVAIPVEEDGLYQVTVLGIRRGAGILQSGVEYEEMLTVNDAVTEGTITHSPEHIIIIIYSQLTGYTIVLWGKEEYLWKAPCNVQPLAIALFSKLTHYRHCRSGLVLQNECPRAKLSALIIFPDL